MEWQILFLCLIGLLFFFLAVGEWIGFALGITGLTGLIILGDLKALQAIGMMGWNTVNSFELTAIPMFIFMGEIMLQSGLSDRFYRSASVFFNRLPGGLLQTNIFACSIFAAISGSSPATAAAIGSVSYPELSKRGYDRKMIIGSLAGGGALGILIPPSIIMIIYGALVQESIEKLFMAGVVPGVVGAIIFMIYIALRCIKNTSLSPESTDIITWNQRIRAIPGLLPFFLMIFIVLGGIYAGVMTPTEAAAFGAGVAIIMSAIVRGINWNSFKHSLNATVRITSMILFIIIGASILSYLVVQSGINRGLTNWIVNTQPSLISFFLIIIVVYLILGCLLDGVSMIFLTIPILLPIITAMDINLIWFGVILTILIEIAQITPPVGLNLYVLQGITGGKLGDVVHGVWPYFILYFALIVLIIIFPDLALWLPEQMYQ